MELLDGVAAVVAGAAEHARVDRVPHGVVGLYLNKVEAACYLELAWRVVGLVAEPGARGAVPPEAGVIALLGHYTLAELAFAAQGEVFPELGQRLARGRDLALHILDSFQ